MREFFSVVKGAPLTVLIAMIELEGIASVEKICELTTYTKPTVYTALRVLQNAEMVVKTHPNYTLTKGGIQPLLSVEKLKNKKILLSSSNINNIDTNKEQLTTTNPERNKKFLLLFEAGIRGDDTLNELVSYKHATLEYLETHVASWRKEKQKVGLLIWRIRQNVPAPEVEDDDPERYIKGKFSEFINH